MTPGEKQHRHFEAMLVGHRAIEEARSEKPHPHSAVGKKILDIERDQYGSVFFAADRQAYIFDGVTREVHPIRLEDVGFASWLNVRYNLSKSDKLTRLVVEFLHDRALIYGEQVTLSHFSHYDSKNNALYIDANDGQVWCLNGEAPPHLLLNGQNVFFVSRPKAPISEAVVGAHGLLMPYLVNDLNFAATKGITPLAQKHLFCAWLHALAFGDWMDEKPILMVEGVLRSGKSMALKRVGHLLNGKSSPIIIKENGEDDFPVQLLRSTPLAHIDNQDRFLKWLPDAVAAYCTGGTFLKRKMYTDDEINEIRANCFIAVSSADPKSFRRNDIADRSIVIRLEQFKTGTEADGHTLIKRIDDNRMKLIGEWLYNLNNIIAALPHTKVERPTSRMVTWERFFHACRTGLGFETQVDALQQAQAERVEFATEENPAIEAILRWLESRSNRRRQDSITDVFDALAVLTKRPDGTESAFARRFKSRETFVKWLRGAASELEYHGILVETKNDPDPRHKGKTLWSFDVDEDED